jgi:hypothetical protein
MDEVEPPLTEYIFRTKHYAVGGIHEYMREFDNEQQRYQITFPVHKDGTANQAYFFHPGEGYQEGDLRHASGCGEVLLYKQVAAALFVVPEKQEDVIVGSLPFGRWKFGQNYSIGDLGDVYLIVHIWQRNEVDLGPHGVKVYSYGRNNGVVMEVVTKEEAESQEITTLEMIYEQVATHPARFTIEDQSISLNYRSFHGYEIGISTQHSSGKVHRLVNNKSYEFGSSSNDTQDETHPSL